MIVFIFVLALISSRINCLNNTAECTFHYSTMSSTWLDVACTRANLAVTSVSNLSELSADLNYTYLMVNYKNFSRLTEPIFVGYEIQMLTLRFDQIEILSDRTFISIKYLKILNLDYNRIKSTSSLYELKFSNTPNRIFTISFAMNFLDRLDQIFPAEFSTLFDLSLKNNHLTNICAHAFENMYTLTSLDLSENDLTHLYAEMFVGLSNLTDLKLNGNDIRMIEVGAFRYLVSLPLLALNQNSLTRLENVLFDETNSIQRILVNVNRLVSLSSSMFENLHRLVDLTMRGNLIKNLDLHLFSNLTCLQNIRVSMNFIQSVDFPNGCVFDRLTIFELSYSNLNEFDFELVVRLMPNLIELDLTSNQIRRISTPDGLFAKSLQFLMLDSNLIDSLATGVFRPFSQLGYLYLNGNLLRLLTERVFTGLINLLVLDLSDNLIVTVHSSTFDGLQSLQTLYLTNNRLKRLPDRCFTSLVSLKELDLSHNRLESIGWDDFIGLINLEKLYLSYNYLTSIEAHFARHMPLLANLDVNENYISIIETYTFSHLSLTYLNLESNLIDTISPKAFFNSTIDYLNLNFNYLANVHVLFELSTAVKRLDAGHNRFKIFTVDRLECQLTGLNLSGNLIEKFRLNNGMFELLRAVNLSHNLMETLLVDDFKYLTGLIELDVSNNPIRFIDEIFFLRLNLESVYLSNILGTIDLNILGTNVTHVDISYNRLTLTDKWEIFAGLKSLIVRATNFTIDQYVYDANWENLTELDLSYGIIDIDLRLLDTFRQLEKLYLAGVNIESIGNVSLNLGHLIELDLSHNRIESIEGEFFRYMHSLLVLDLSYNSINRVDDMALNSLIWLQTLNLENNNIVDFYFPDLSKLIWVNLNNNRMVNFFSTVKLGGLQLLDLSHNHLKSVRFDVLFDIFFNDLVELYLNDNRLEYLSGQSLSTLNNLETIDLKNNQIVGVDEMALMNLRNLQELNLSNNKLTFESNVNVFGQLYQLKSLNLSFNRIERLNEQLFSGLFKLRVLDLRGNGLKTIERLAFANLGQLVYIDVANNTNLMIREGGFSGLESIKDVWISYDQLEDNKRTLIESFNLTRVRSVGEIDYYRSVYINYRESPSSVDCWLVLDFVKVKLQLKLKSDADYLEFLRNCLLSVEF